MSALTYLTLTQLKNRFKGIFRSPAKLIYTIFLLAMLVLVLFSGTMAGEDGLGKPDSRLGGLIVGYFALMFLLTVNTGFSTGMSIFKMPDVNFLFVGPFKPVRVLFHGMFNQMATSLLMALVILFQYGWMHGEFGVGVGGLLIVVVGYGLAVFTGQITAMVIYAVSSGRSRVRKTLRVIFVGITVLWIAYILYSAIGEDDLLKSICDASVSSIGRLFPVAGWLGAACYEAILGSYASAGVLVIIWAVYTAALIIVMTRVDQDYYEDVLQSTETTFAAQSAAKAGRIADAAPKKVSVGKTGLGGGFGASAFYYKHRVENRRSRKFLLSGTEIIFVIVNLGFAFFMREAGIIPVLAFAAYMMFFYVAMGRLVKEMTRPYVYLVPEPPMKKLLWCLRESAAGYLTSAILCFVPMLFYVQAPMPSILAAGVAYFTYAYLFTAGNLVTERVFGTVTVKALTFFFYFVVLIILAIPGIATAVLVVISLPEWCALLALSGANVLVTLLAMFLCRNILACAEMNN